MSSARPRTPVVVYDNVVKRFGPLTVLDGVTAHVDRGEVVCLIGPSGSGKSTLLRCTNALETVDGGQVIFDGKPMPEAEAERRRIRQRMGMVFQSFELFPHMTAIGNVACGRHTVLGEARDAAEARAIALLDKVGLRDKATRLSEHAVRRTAAARRHRPRARHGPGGDAVRRADLGARSRDGRRSAEHHEAARRGRHDDDRRHPRDELRPARRPIG